MSKKRKRKPLGSKAEQFAEALAENEEHMAEMAAFAVTCEQFMIDEEEGYDLLASLAPKTEPTP